MTNGGISNTRGLMRDWLALELTLGEQRASSEGGVEPTGFALFTIESETMACSEPVSYTGVTHGVGIHAIGAYRVAPRC